MFRSCPEPRRVPWWAVAAVFAGSLLGAAPGDDPAARPEKARAGEVRPESTPPPRIEPESPRGVFAAGEAPAFIVEAGAQPPVPRILDVDGREAGAASLEKIAEGRFRLSAGSLGPGYYRLVFPSAEGRPESSVSFAVLQGRPREAGDPFDPIASDAAISWLVARPGADPADVDDCLRLARLAGLGLLRDRIAWGEVEPRPGEFRWGRYDSVATASKKAGIAVYQIFHASPRWSRADQNPKRIPDDLRSGFRFARAAQAHFEGRVVAWEPWNEPDIPTFSEDTADQLAAFQKATCLGFKAASAGAKVAMVSLAHPPGLFIESFLENETGPYFEIYNYHTYDSLEGYRRRAEAHLDVMSRFGLGDKSVWVTEAGIALQAPAGDLSPQDAVRQAEFLPKAYVLSIAYGKASLSWIHFFFILPHFLENGVQFGLLEKGLRPGPGYVALAALAAALGKAAGPESLRGLPEGMTGWLFDRGDGLCAAAVWAGKETTLAAADLEARDLFGRRLEPGPGGALPIGDRLMYLIGKRELFNGWSPERIQRLIRSSRPDFTLTGVVLRFVFPPEKTDKAREAWRAGSEGALEGKLQVYNFSGKAFQGSVKVSGDPGLRVDPAERPVSVGPEGLETIEVKLGWGWSGDAVRKVRAVAVPGGASGERERSSAAVARIVK